MSCDEVSNEELLREVQVWCRTKKAGRFRNWDMDDFINETWVAARCLVDDKYDRTKGSLSTFIQRFLWDVVFRIYCRQHQIQIIRRRSDDQGTAYLPREYRPMFTTSPLDHATIQEDCYASSHEVDGIDIERYPALTDQQHSIIQMIGRGMNHGQIGHALDRTASWVSNELKKIRNVITSNQ
jgi:hypothetical protein